MWLYFQPDTLIPNSQNKYISVEEIKKISLQIKDQTLYQIYILGRESREINSVNFKSGSRPEFLLGEFLMPATWRLACFYFWERERDREIILSYFEYAYGPTLRKKLSPNGKAFSLLPMEFRSASKVNVCSIFQRYLPGMFNIAQLPNAVQMQICDLTWST